MFTKKVKTRLIILFFLLTISILIIYFFFRSLEDNVVYFFSPTEIFNKTNIEFNKKVRIGGLVKVNSIIKNDKSTIFVITDFKNEIIVNYEGLVPNLFAEEKGVIAEGKLKDKKYLFADKILAKHDENYMPPEVIKALNKSQN
jgi:cytochrome c-type biogenesis protein CcmE